MLGQRPSRSWLAYGGIIGPFLFAALVIVQGRLQPDYSHVALPISALSAWPAGWMQNLNFFAAGILNGALAIALHQSVGPTRYGVLGITLLLAGCAGVFLAGVFPWIDLNGLPTETPQHVVAAVLAFSCTSIGLVVLSRRMAADPAWRGLSAYVLGTGLVMFALFIVVGFFAVEAGTPFHAWAGLLQRITVGVWFACLVVLARRVLALGARG